MNFVILNIDEEKKEMLVVAEKPTEQEITIQGLEGYENGIDELDRLCREITRNRRS